MKNPNRFYTYAYLREDRTPYYIGKGEGKRAYYKYNYEIKPPKDKLRIILLKQNLTEEESFRHEKYMIAVFGRIDLGTGILRNKTDGGEGNSGGVRTEEWRRNHSQMMKGRVRTEEWRRNHSQMMKGRWRSEEWRKNHSQKMLKGENHPFYGEKRPDLAERNKKRKGENNPCYGKKWWNDGNGNNKKSVECPGEGWFPGVSEEIRKKQSQSRKGKNNHMYGKKGENNPCYGKKWWNDGKGNSKMSVECPGEGWFPGRGKLPRKLKTTL